ncbi:hypothetical protein NDU88_002224 [Pleurodeles waltl]|uniref:Uncharacterized protein n=1 Tax=Pleurodeles waltl TaxID=8319 RepID=A0AAV7VZ23_PLEWA|nr:hypothetical protein NDU88_002224 [Pleurodeles waltl]
MTASVIMAMSGLSVEEAVQYHVLKLHITYSAITNVLRRIGDLARPSRVATSVLQVCRLFFPAGALPHHLLGPQRSPRFRYVWHGTARARGSVPRAPTGSPCQLAPSSAPSQPPNSRPLPGTTTSQPLLFQRTLSLQHRRNLRAISQELAVTNRPPICTNGRRPRGLHFHYFSTPFFRSPLPAHSLPVAPLQPQGRLTRACRYQSASDLYRRLLGPYLHRLSTPFFRPPLPAHSFPAASPQPQGRLPRACHYQSTSDLHRRPPAAGRVACAFTVSALRSSCHLSQRTLSLQYHRSLRAISQELTATNWPPICATGRAARAFTVSAPRSAGHLFQRTLSLQHGRSLEAVSKRLPLPIGLQSAPPAVGHVARAFTVSALCSLGHLLHPTLSLQHCCSLRDASQELAVTNRPPFCTIGHQPFGPHLHRLSIPFFRPPLPAHSLPTAPPQLQGRLPRTCRYQLASNLHRRRPAARPTLSPSQHPILQASCGSLLPTRPHSELGWRCPCGSPFRGPGSHPRASRLLLTVPPSRFCHGIPLGI